jgi:1,2-diacylglycerol-3-alpha-glucose alpha-1,2-galactosyltransferase
MSKSKIKLNLFAEKFIGQANGVTTAFLEDAEALSKEEEIELSINSSFINKDVIHFHSMGLKYIFFSFFFKKKIVLSAHVVPDSFTDSLVLSRYWYPLMKKYLRFAYNRASLIIAVSPVVQSELEKIGVKTKMITLCNAVNRNKFQPNASKRKEIRKILELKESDFVVISVGQIQPRKGVRDFLDTARHCPQIKFVWVGGRPFGHLTSDYYQLNEEIKNAPANVIFTGIIDFSLMPAYYAASDVYFMPSFQENFAFATIEASAVKLPLVLRDNPEYPPTLFHHYLKGNNASEFAQIIQNLADHQKEFQHWQNESDTLASLYEVTAHTQKLISCYKELL